MNIGDFESGNLGRLGFLWMMPARRRITTMEPTTRGRSFTAADPRHVRLADEMARQLITRLDAEA